MKTLNSRERWLIYRYRQMNEQDRQKLMKFAEHFGLTKPEDKHELDTAARE